MYSRATITSHAAPREETGRPYEEIEFEDKKLNGTSPKTNGEIISNAIPAGWWFIYLLTGLSCGSKFNFDINFDKLFEFDFFQSKIGSTALVLAHCLSYTIKVPRVLFKKQTYLFSLVHVFMVEKPFMSTTYKMVIQM